MECFVGIDLGSTTTKAVIIDSKERVLGKGITNSRSNYALACQIAQEEATISARMSLLEEDLKNISVLEAQSAQLLCWISAKFSLGQHLRQLNELEQECRRLLEKITRLRDKVPYQKALERVFGRMNEVAVQSFQPGERSSSDFLRDIASERFLGEAETVASEMKISFERLASLFDQAILHVENQNFAQYYAVYLEFTCEEIAKLPQHKSVAQLVAAAVRRCLESKIDFVNSVGTGYGRLTLPFEKDQIRSEILCHGLGAHTMFPHTRTILDIGGQDTKAIQVDSKGVVSGFQMNDRCAAGCGRYLGYIADEMSIGVHELGPLAMKSDRPAKINSTCTVFAGAEFRERLALGERREDIVAGLHRAIILRAMSLLARSGGVTSELTFTGGVAKNEAAVAMLGGFVRDNYGEVKMNISPDSIYTGALGAAVFALRDHETRKP